MSKNVTINDKVLSPHVPPGASVGGNEYNKFGHGEMEIDVERPGLA